MRAMTTTTTTMTTSATTVRETPGCSPGLRRQEARTRGGLRRHRDAGPSDGWRCGDGDGCRRRTGQLDGRRRAIFRGRGKGGRRSVRCRLRNDHRGRRRRLDGPELDEGSALNGGGGALAHAAVLEGLLAEGCREPIAQLDGARELARLDGVGLEVHEQRLRRGRSLRRIFGERTLADAVEFGLLGEPLLGQIGDLGAARLSQEIGSAPLFGAVQLVP